MLAHFLLRRLALHSRLVCGARRLPPAHSHSYSTATAAGAGKSGGGANGAKPPLLGPWMRLGLGVGIVGAGVYAAGLGIDPSEVAGTVNGATAKMAAATKTAQKTAEKTADMPPTTTPSQASAQAPAPTTPAFDADKVTVAFVLGGPGAGKGTQCQNIVRDFGFVHLSAGDLLRAERMRPGSQYGDLINHYIKEGLIVPMDITIALLEQAMKESASTRFLIDGFPRAMDQALQFERQVVPSRLVLYFECPEEVMLKRLLKRGETSGRVDDNIESIKKRFKTFRDTSYPVIEHYDGLGKVCKISCVNPPEKVYEEVKAAIQTSLGAKTAL